MDPFGVVELERTTACVAVVQSSPTVAGTTWGKSNHPPDWLEQFCGMRSARHVCWRWAVILMNRLEVPQNYAGVGCDVFARRARGWCVVGVTIAGCFGVPEVTTTLCSARIRPRQVCVRAFFRGYRGRGRGSAALGTLVGAESPRTECVEGWRCGINLSSAGRFGADED